MIKVKIEIPKRTAERGLLAKQKIAALIGLPMARAIRRRVQQKAKTIKRFAGYGGDKPMLVSPSYPAIAGGKPLAFGPVWFQSSEEFHRLQGTKPGSFSVAGGMWAGLTVLVFARGAKVLFRGRSQGWGVKKTKKGKKLSKAKINNALKAWTLLHRHRQHINVLEVAADEFNAIQAGLQLALRNVITKQLPAKIDWTGVSAGGSSKLAREIGSGKPGRRT